MNDHLEHRRTIRVIGSPIDAITWRTAVDRLLGWARNRESRYVCICNAHSLVTASKDEAFRRALEHADMATPDGAPVAWMLRRLGVSEQQRINGPDLMLRLCERAGAEGVSIFLLGSTPETLRLLQSQLAQTFPKLNIAGALSPPFRPLSSDEEEAQTATINASGAGIVFVSLGCPKQELWMARGVKQIRGVMIGVGAAFDFHAGTVARAPQWMRVNGLEWLHRLWSEPRRLWKRYLVTNTLFITEATLQLLRRGAP